MKLIRTVALLVAIVFLMSSAAWAQDPVPLTAIAERGHVGLSAGAFVLTTGDDWSGASLGAVAGYNLHSKLSLFGGYDRGIALNDVDEDLDLFRAVANVRIHPSAFVGFGYAWFDDDIEGGLVQLTVFKPIMRRLDLAGSYSHVFSQDELTDFEYVKVGLNYHLIGKE